MKEFKYILKVDPTNPQRTLERLGELVIGEAEAFADIDIEFVKSQEFITAVPIEIALTIPMRAQILYNNPECRFIVTGVPSFRIKNLTEFGYQVYTTKVEIPKEEEEGQGQEGPCDEKCDEGALRCADEEEKKPAPHVHVPVKLQEELPAPVKKYYIGGNEVSKEDFLAKVNELKKKFQDSGFNFAGPISKLFTWDIL